MDDAFEAESNVPEKAVKKFRSLEWIAALYAVIVIAILGTGISIALVQLDRADRNLSINSELTLTTLEEAARAKPGRTNASSEFVRNVEQRRALAIENLKTWEDIRSTIKTIIKIVPFTMLVLPVIFSFIFLHHFYRRAKLLESYARKLSQEQYEDQPFQSNDCTGNLSAMLFELGHQTRNLLTQTRRHATAIKKEKERAEHLANHDHLTNLLNRRAFYDAVKSYLDQEKRRGQAFLLFFDLDHFKEINDYFGHSAGDILLQAVSSRIKNLLRSDDIVARMGGDEFAALVYCNDENIHNLAARLISSISRSVQTGSNVVHVSSSIGIRKITPIDTDFNTLIEHADVAMYRAKQLGRNNFQFYSEGLEDNVAERQNMVNLLRIAIENRQLEVVLQPKVDLFNEKIIGCEALLRWHHPHKGELHPVDFLQDAEHSGLISSIGSWSIKESCRLAAQLNQYGQEIRISINICSTQLHNPYFVEFLESSMNLYQLPARLVDLEISESSLMENMANSIDVLKSLKTLGVNLVIDDFGTGFSSLTYINKLPVDAIKVDENVIKLIDHAGDGNSLIKTIILIGKEMGIRVIAEGVENIHQAELLRDFGCDEAQGYYFSRPLSFPEALRFIFGKGDNNIIQFQNKNNV
ncbi:MAG: EAL domain-containing protein [Gammaproteobacteria bacterium]|nr:EAL domain-containing protein [Gammaproteobacteria bacterium]